MFCMRTFLAFATARGTGLEKLREDPPATYTLKYASFNYYRWNNENCKAYSSIFIEGVSFPPNLTVTINGTITVKGDIRALEEPERGSF